MTSASAPAAHADGPPAAEAACPVCGGPNACAPAASGSFATPCGGTTVTILPHVLAALPTAARGRACLCVRCATALAGSPAPLEDSTP